MKPLFLVLFFLPLLPGEIMFCLHQNLESNGSLPVIWDARGVGVDNGPPSKGLSVRRVPGALISELLCKPLGRSPIISSSCFVCH
jgi:hypothetical protein